MALTWDASRVKDWDKLKDDKHAQIVTEAIIFDTMWVGIGEITEKNAEEFFMRRKLWHVACELDGDVMYGDARPPYHVTLDDIKARIGLRTNVADTTGAEFMRRLGAASKLIKRRY